MPVRLHHLFVVGGLAAGIAAGVLLLDTDPAAMGWLLGAGSGLAGGAFIAAMVSGEQLASGGGDGSRTRRRGVNPALRHLENTWQPTAPPSTNGKHEDHPSETPDRSPEDRPRERPE